MAWIESSRYYWRYPQTLETSPLEINQRCFIRKEHKCGKMFGASKSCFIACPTDTELEPILGLLSEKLTKVGVEPIIAVKERAYGQDIFCTKICGKIIESKFCVVILDDTIVNKKNIPNPNVYYEYGLMTSLRKHIIPLQKEKLDLAFNIQSYDTIKYNSGNIAVELDRAIRDAIRITESSDHNKREELVPERSILRNMELSGFEAKGDNWFLSDVVDDTEFKGFGNQQKKFYLYLGKMDEQSEAGRFLEDLNVIMYRTEKKVDEIEQKIIVLKQRKKELLEEEKQIKEDPRRNIRTPSLFRYRSDNDSEIKELEGRLSLMDTIFIGFLFNSKIDISDFTKKAKIAVKRFNRYKLTYNKNNELQIGDIKVTLVSSLT